MWTSLSTRKKKIRTSYPSHPVHSYTTHDHIIAVLFVPFHLGPLPLDAPVGAALLKKSFSTVSLRRTVASTENALYSASGRAIQTENPSCQTTASRVRCRPTGTHGVQRCTTFTMSTGCRGSLG